MKRTRYFNRSKLNPRIPLKIAKLKTPKNTKFISYSDKNKSSPSRSKSYKNTIIIDEGYPTLSKFTKNIKDGQIYVDSDTGDVYLFSAKLGWISMSGWQPDVGEGLPDNENPPDPLSGDQYLDILTGDLYVYSQGLGWVLQNAIEGPRGPPGESFDFNLIIMDGPHGPDITNPLQIKSGDTLKLWLEDTKIKARID